MLAFCGSFNVTLFPVPPAKFISTSRSQSPVSEATVRTHITSILEKLALRDRVQVMAYAIKRGIVQAEDLM